MKRILTLVVAAAVLTACGGPARKAGKTEENHEKTMMTGGYTDPRQPDAKELELFRQVTAGLTGVEYTPENVATQVVAGLNYRFVCKASTVTPDPETYRAEIIVYQPLPGRGEARITGIKRL